MSAELEHVSDTALMVAAARALESERDDALIHDPFAAALAGDRGRAILLEYDSRGPWMAFGVGLRTLFLDQFLLREIAANQIDSVVSLGAGLDARPWRFDFPAGFRWLEVDFEPILDYKYNLMQNQPPRCRLERLTADVTNEKERRRVWDTLGMGARTVLLSEGLLLYLPGDSVRAIASEAFADGRTQSWIVDFFSPNLAHIAHGDRVSEIDRLRDPTRLEPDDLRRTLTEAGWSQAEERRFVRDGRSFARARVLQGGLPVSPDAPRPSEDDPGGVYLFRRTL